MQNNKMKRLEAIYEADLPPRAILVWLYLQQRANKEGTCFPALKTIAHDTKMSVSTVKRAITDLITAGVLEKETRYRENKGQTSNLYRL